MSNKNLKLTSVRLDPDTLTKIDNFAAKHGYWTRNSIINNILTAVMSKFSERQVYDMCRLMSFSNCPVMAIFEIRQIESNETSECSDSM